MEFTDIKPMGCSNRSSGAILISFQHLLWMGEGLFYLNGDSLSGHQELLQEIISRLLFFLGLDSGNTFTAIVLQNLAKVLNY